MNAQAVETATFANGCFWCTEAIFQRLKGILSVASGYTGGNPPAGGENPTYEQVSTGTTGHAEAIQITFDPKVISFDKLLAIFWATHNPTTLNQQGADKGTQYRSAIFYHTPEQEQVAISSKENLEKKHTYTDPITTEIVPFDQFYKAEDYHKNYYEKNRNAPYCMYVINPKLQKLLKEFANFIPK